MSIKFHPSTGMIVICDFKGFVAPEMVKRRPSIVVSPRFRERDNLCTIVPLSTTDPYKVMPYHYKLIMRDPLPAPYNSPYHWVKADMLCAVSFNRLRLPFIKKKFGGERDYKKIIIMADDLIEVRKCILQGLGMNTLTQHL